MKKKQRDEIIVLLDELIAFCGSSDRISMKNAYQSIKDDLLNGVSIDKKWALRYFSGYLIKADPPDYEYVRVEKLFSFFEGKPKKNSCNSSQLDDETEKHLAYFKYTCSDH